MIYMYATIKNTGTYGHTQSGMWPKQNISTVLVFTTKSVMCLNNTYCMVLHFSRKNVLINDN